MTAELVCRVDVPAPAELVFAEMLNWRRQSEWVLGTQVSVTGGDGHSVGSTVEAVTGIGPLAVTDSMRITEWDPPHVCRVVHTGAVVRGEGVFRVLPTEDGSTVEWTELLELPFGRITELGWPLVRPMFAVGVRYSLQRFAKQVTALAENPEHGG